jgi:hypothetical protein
LVAPELDDALIEMGCPGGCGPFHAEGLLTGFTSSGRAHCAGTRCHAPTDKASRHVGRWPRHRPRGRSCRRRCRP